MKKFKIKMEKWECLNEKGFKGLNVKRAFWITGVLETYGTGPLGVDIFAPYFFAQDIAKKFKSILLPSLPFSISKNFTGHPGTVTLTPKTFKKIVKEVIYSLHLNKIEELFIFNGHGGADEIVIVYSKFKFSLKGIDKIFDFKRLKGFKSFPYPSDIMLYRDGKIDSDFSKLSTKYYNKVLKFIENSIENVIRGWARI